MVRAARPGVGERSATASGQGSARTLLRLERTNPGATADAMVVHAAGRLPENSPEAPSPAHNPGGTVAHRAMKAGTCLAFLLLASPCLAATAEDEALAENLLVCAAKFGGLTMLYRENGAEESHAFWWAATKLAGPGFVEDRTKATASKAGDWLFRKDGPTPTYKEASATCVPFLKRALEEIKSGNPDARPE